MNDEGKDIVKLRKYVIVLAIVLAFFVLTSEAQAAKATFSDLYCQAAVDQAAPAVVHTQTASGETWLFLPASSNLSALTFYFDGDAAKLSANGSSLDVQSGAAFDLTALFPAAPDNGVYTVEIRRGRQSLSLNIMVSANTASLFLTSDDPDSKGRTWIEQSKDNRTSGQVCMLSPQGEVIYAGGLKQIKGRGNSTWTSYPKKPYQIKLSTSSDLMENGEAATTWILLANYCDESLLHNRFTFDLALDLGLEYSPHCRPIDLYYDGEYRGSYLLSEKTEVKTNRIEIEDLEKAIEKANPDISDFDALPVVQGKTPAGNPCQYVSGIVLPEDYSGGYLLEIDYEVRARDEASWFLSSLGRYMVVKSPEFLPKEAMDYISSYWEEFETALKSGGVNPETGKSYDAYADATSLAKIYLLEELSQDPDSFRSSCFFYKGAGGAAIHAGPVWDFDSCYGSDDMSTGTTGILAGQTVLCRLLLTIPSFRDEVQRCWNEEMYPLLQAYLSGQNARSISAYGSELAASQRMNAVLWPSSSPASYSAAVSDFQLFVSQRTQWLQENMSSWTPEAAFIDVEKDSWYGDAVSYVAEHNLFAGTTEIFFEPQVSMTRGMTVTVLYRLAGSPDFDGGDSGFNDVIGHTWYSNAVAWAASEGIVMGRDDGGFYPNDKVSRQELVSLLYRFAQSQGADMSTSQISDEYTDRDSIAAWAEDAFAWAVHQGLIVGTDARTLSPQDKVLRNQAAVFFQRFDQFMNR